MGAGFSENAERHGRRLQELRRSNAAGTHQKRRKDRRNQERKAIDRSKGDE